MVGEVGKEYGSCMVVIENNTVGWASLSKLQETGYPNLYYSRKSTHEYVDSLQAEYAGVVPGFSTTQKTRPLVIAKMEEFVRNKLINIKSKRLFNEMKTFIWHNGKPQAMKNHNDDLVMACAIGCWVKDTVYSSSQRNVEYQRAFLSSYNNTNKELNTMIPGMVGYRPIQKQKELKTQQEQYKEFTWLLKG